MKNSSFALVEWIGWLQPVPVQSRVASRWGLHSLKPMSNHSPTWAMPAGLAAAATVSWGFATAAPPIPTDLAP
jgi:hypothetical protein